MPRIASWRKRWASTVYGTIPAGIASRSILAEERAVRFVRELARMESHATLTASPDHDVLIHFVLAHPASPALLALRLALLASLISRPRRKFSVPMTASVVLANSAIPAARQLWEQNGPMCCTRSVYCGRR